MKQRRVDVSNVNRVIDWAEAKLIRFEMGRLRRQCGDRGHAGGVSHGRQIEWDLYGP